MEQLPPTGGSLGAILYTSQKSGELAPLLMPVTPLLWSFPLPWLTVHIHLSWFPLVSVLAFMATETQMNGHQEGP